MAVTQTIRYKGSYQEAVVLRQMLEEQGVHVELQRKGRKQLKRAQRRVGKRQVLVERAELLERHDREERELLQRLDQEPREPHERHTQELHELDRRHDRERGEMGMPPKGADAEPAPLVALREMLRADHDEVGISLRGTGATAAIAETVTNFQEAAPDSRVRILPRTSRRASASPRHATEGLKRGDQGER